MLKEALSMILGPHLIFCINYTQRKLKRCFSRAQHFYAYTPLAKSAWKSWSAHCKVLCFSVVWCRREGALLVVSQRNHRRDEERTVGASPLTSVTTSQQHFFVYKFVDIRLLFLLLKEMFKNHKMKSEDFDPHAARKFVVTSNTKKM